VTASWSKDADPPNVIWRASVNGVGIAISNNQLTHGTKVKTMVELSPD
jgi:hypothetical protein